MLLRRLSNANLLICLYKISYYLAEFAKVSYTSSYFHLFLLIFLCRQDNLKEHSGHGWGVVFPSLLVFRLSLEGN